jgi:hypothetical protein
MQGGRCGGGFLYSPTDMAISNRRILRGLGGLTRRCSGLVRCGDFCAEYGARDEIHMKNTGKRIFFGVVAFLAVNVSVVVLAGALTSSR